MSSASSYGRPARPVLPMGGRMNTHANAFSVGGAGGEEDASLLKLGPDFQHANCLFNSEVAILLNSIREERAVAQEANAASSINPYRNIIVYRTRDISSIFGQFCCSSSHLYDRMFVKVFSHANTFSRFTNKEMTQHIRRLLYSTNSLMEFEMAQLANLCPETAEEAKTLVPRRDKIHTTHYMGIFVFS